jgi:Na+-translocating ferredoxin:NAD+ oxidoreductase RnfC subunit
MSVQETILRADATYDLTVKVGDKVRRGDKLSQNPSPGAQPIMPATGVIARIQFDPEHHEFVIAIAQTT